MDPNLFHLDWERVGEVLTAIIVLAFVLERALAVLFESRLFVKRFEGKGVKEWVAAAVRKNGALRCRCAARATDINLCLRRRRDRAQDN